LLPFEVSDQKGEDSDLPDKMNDFSITDEEKNLPVAKKVELYGMMDKVTINGKKFDPDRIDFTQEQGDTEVWEIYNKPDEMEVWSIHFIFTGLNIKSFPEMEKNHRKMSRAGKILFP